MWILEWSDTDAKIGEYDSEIEALNVVNRMVKIYGYKKCPPMMMHRLGLGLESAIRGDDLLNKAEMAVWRRDWFGTKNVGDYKGSNAKERNNATVPMGQSSLPIHDTDALGGHAGDESGGTRSVIRKGLTYRKGSIRPRR